MVHPGSQEAAPQGSSPDSARHPPGPVEDGFALAVLDALPDATAILDRAGTIIAVNRVWEMFALDNGGRPETTGVGVSYLDVCARAVETGAVEAPDVLAGLRAVLAGSVIETEREYPCPSPAVGRWFISRITPIVGSFGGAVASHVNITRRKLSEEQLAHGAAHDPLTGLANRMLLTKRFGEAVGVRPGRSDAPNVGLLFIDLDGFKQINDSYGHAAGDELLLLTTGRLLAHVRPQDTVARLGGDEFVVVAPRVSAADLAALAERLDAALSCAHQIHGELVRVPGSIGTHLARPGDTLDDALRRADLAMYARKTSRTP